MREREWRPGTKEWRKFRRRESGRENKCVFTVHRVHGRPVGLAEIGGDMSAAALESPARSLRCSEGVIGCLLFLSPPLPSLPLLPWIFSSSGPADSFFFSHPFREPSHAWQVQEKRETAEVYGEEEEGKETEGRDTGEGLQTTEGDRRQKEGARPIAEQFPAFHFISWHFYGGSFSSKTVMYKKKIEVLIVSYIAKYTRRSEMLPPLFWFFGFRNLVAGILLPFSYRSINESGCWCWEW